MAGMPSGREMGYLDANAAGQPAVGRNRDDAARFRPHGGGRGRLGGGDGHRPGAEPGRFLQGQERRPLCRLQRRRRLRSLCPGAGAAHRRPHPRQPDRHRQEHGGRRQPAARQLALPRRAEGRLGVRHHRPRHRLRPAAQPAGRAVRRTEVHLDRQRQSRGQRLRRLWRPRRRDQVRRSQEPGNDGRRHRRQRRHRPVPARSSTACSAPR